ncbi:hypothetical protein L195_g027892 [Trifolium pratense]|uniref:Uncharacterized protein n=1 Tax=Trifolium pratense TaxID=57577 RepID=A0A2K3L0D7_TRIPR|nr:hypothetical protein L195_g027892 [Trifolium pratense]
MSHTKTRMEEAWTIEELAFNVPGLSIYCFIHPSELRFASISEASELSAFHKVRYAAEQPQGLPAVIAELTRWATQNMELTFK